MPDYTLDLQCNSRSAAAYCLAVLGEKRRVPRYYTLSYLVSKVMDHLVGAAAMEYFGLGCQVAGMAHQSGLWSRYVCTHTYVPPNLGIGLALGPWDLKCYNSPVVVPMLRR